MKKHLLLPAVALIVSSFTSAQAQTDTTKHELGRISVQKKFTQSVTVKGADLEKMPFTSLGDAVNTWFYGVYGTGAYATVVDGNLINDINAYSIYDIEEITLVQNSLTQLNGISPNQVLLLVKTKRSERAGQSGIDVNGQTNLVTLRNTAGTGTTSTNLYHQYYVSPYVNTGQVKAGISAAFQQSATPMFKNTIPGKPYTLTRVKINGYFDAKMGNNNTLMVDAGYTPQSDTLNNNFVTASTIQTVSYHIKQNVLHASIKLNSNILKKLSNTFSAGLQNYYFEGDLYSKSVMQYSVSTQTSTAHNDTNAHIINYLVKDNLSYKATAGNWLFEPNVNFTFSQFKNNVRNRVDNLSSTSFGYLSGGYFQSEVNYLQKSAILTPSLAVSYADAFLVQGGIAYLLNWTSTNPFQAQSAYNKPKFLPFASLSVNLLQSSAGDDPKTKLMVYASFAKSMANMTDYSASLSDGSAQTAPANYLPGGYSNAPSLAYSNPNYNPYRTFDQLQAGATLSLLNRKLTLSYNYNVRKYATVSLAPVYISGSTDYSGFYYLLSPSQRLDLHRLEVAFKAVRTNDFAWTTILNGTVAKLDNYYTSANSSGLFGNPTSVPAGNVTTGAFINRFTYKKFTGGLDILYRINEDAFTFLSVTKGNINSFDLKNIYVGYQLTPQGTRGLEFFINGRNIIQNKQSDITDNRRFYGFGIKLEL